MGFDIEEIKTYLAQRGEIQLLKIIYDLEEEYSRYIDPDYEMVENSDTDSECSTGDLVEEQFKINPSMNGFQSLA